MNEVVHSYEERARVHRELRKKVYCTVLTAHVVHTGTSDGAMVYALM